MANKSPADLLFEGILANASALELQTPTPPPLWVDSWTVENGCAQFPGHCAAHWNEERLRELDRREREQRPTAASTEFNPSDPLYNMPWKRAVEAADALGCSRGAIYRWQHNPSEMPLMARRLLAFFMHAPQYTRDLVLKQAPSPKAEVATVGELEEYNAYFDRADKVPGRAPMTFAQWKAARHV